MIYFCIPCHNEERTIGVLLWKIRQVMADFPRDYHLLVLNDGSTDATQEVLERYTRVLPLTVARHATRRGYGPSIEALLREAARRAPYPKRDLAVTLQADFTDDPEFIPALVKRCEAGADVVIGSTMLDGEEAPRPVRWGRKAMGLVTRRLRWPEGVTDAVSGFRAYRIVTLRRALEERGEGTPLLRTDGWTTNVELLRNLTPYTRRVAEAPAIARYARMQRESRFDPWQTMKQLMRFVWADRRGVQLPAPEGPDAEIVEIPDALPQAERLAAERPQQRERERERAGPGRNRGRGNGAGGRSATSGSSERPRAERPARNEPKPKRKRNERTERPPQAEKPVAVATENAASVESSGTAENAAAPEGVRKRPRRSRGGRGRRRKNRDGQPQEQAAGESPESTGEPEASTSEVTEPAAGPDATATDGSPEGTQKPKRRRRRGGAGRRRRRSSNVEGAQEPAAGAPGGSGAEVGGAAQEAAQPRETQPPADAQPQRAADASQD